MAITTLVLAAAFLAGQQPPAEAQKGWVIEVRGYTYHAPAKPQEWIIDPVFPKEMRPGQPQPARIDVIEAIYVDDLRRFFETLKKEKP
jgi:hypothetical protein